MVDMGIADVAMEMNAIKLQSEVSMRVTKMAMDITQQLNEEMLNLMSGLTGVGQNIDVSV